MGALNQLKELLATTPNMMVNGRGMIEFTCFQCKPKRVFPDIDQHKMHCEEIHLSVISYKILLMHHLGSEQSRMMSLEQKTEKQIIDLIKRFDLSIARRNR